MKKWKLRTQSGIGFAVVLAFTCILGIAGVLSLGNISRATTANQQVNTDRDALNAVDKQIAWYRLNSHYAGRQEQAKAKGNALSGLDQIIKGIAATADASGENPKTEKADGDKPVLNAYQRYRKVFFDITALEERAIEVSKDIDLLFADYEDIIKLGTFNIEEIMTGQKLLSAGITAYFERPTTQRKEQNDAITADLDNAIEQ